MISAVSLFPANTVTYRHSRPVLSDDTIGKLKELGINISGITSEAQAKRIIAEKTQPKKAAEGNLETDLQLEKIYQRIKNLALRLNVTVSSEERIETMLSKIQARIAVFEEDNNNANISAIRSEYDSIKYTYETITGGHKNLFTGLDMLGKTNRIVMGISDVKK